MNETTSKRVKRLKPMEERLGYSIKETARLLGVGDNTAYAAAKAGQIPTIKIGNREIVPAAWVRNLGQAS